MFIEVYDDEQPAVVWLFCGRENGPDCHARWLRAMQRLDATSGTRGGGALLVIDDGNPSPPASLRSEIATVARSITGSTPLAVVTSSTVARTIIAGLHLTGIAGFPIKGFAAEADGMAWLAQQSGGRVVAATMDEMMAEARQRATRTHAGPAC